ncbi:hypothetical protein DFH09DRAFT_1084412 [Mycena vulgaris]|nr:hypothetical protein DFH09DRAFT_1084412 [Mycena vulgaris]
MCAKKCEDGGELMTKHSHRLDQSISPARLTFLLFYLHHRLHGKGAKTQARQLLPLQQITGASTKRYTNLILPAGASFYNKQSGSKNNHSFGAGTSQPATMPMEDLHPLSPGPMDIDPPPASPNQDLQLPTRFIYVKHHIHSGKPDNFVFRCHLPGNFTLDLAMVRPFRKTSWQPNTPTDCPIREKMAATSSSFIALEHVVRGALLCPIFGGKAGMHYIIDCVDEDIESLRTGLKRPQGCRDLCAPCHGLGRLVSRSITPRNGLGLLPSHSAASLKLSQAVSRSEDHILLGFQLKLVRCSARKARKDPEEPDHF